MDPYDPQSPSTPETFAGRSDLVARAESLVQRAIKLRRGSAMLVHGHRGSGKTSALRKVRSTVEERVPEAIAVEIPLHHVNSSEALLLQTVVEEILRLTRERKETSGWWGKVSRRLAGVNFAVLGTGGGFSLNPQVTSHQNWLTTWRDCMSALDGIPLVALSIDDADLLNPAGIGTLKSIAESDLPVPVLLSVAGGPEMIKRLSKSVYSPVARVFSGATFDMEAFKGPETREALEAPLRIAHSTSSWTPQAVQEIHALSHGYPYLVKCFASAAYADGKKLTVDDVKAAVERGVEIAKPWLEREISTASDADIRAFVKIARLGKDVLRSSEMVELGIQSPYIGRLVKLEVLHQVSRGLYELRKAPAIAYYYQARRRLRVD